MHKKDHQTSNQQLGVPDRTLETAAPINPTDSACCENTQNTNASQKSADRHRSSPASPLVTIDQSFAVLKRILVTAAAATDSRAHQEQEAASPPKRLRTAPAPHARHDAGADVLQAAVDTYSRVEKEFFDLSEAVLEMEELLLLMEEN
eukprot:CAMPEP_0194274022 /NCGR_PEP_ID=MMETSP0169-20130528/7214_1 /TAXON_ID=218684 /ORGANISM="Corethron pennatum, Strain L29A3" /LENGTH=147 /DNA_ID=CAMNT_0039017117 /DNA_START=507 /DNA_END=950 /DNA_ORIENTATION=-